MNPTAVSHSGAAACAESFLNMVRIRKLIAQVAQSDATVLILGESGTGKEVVANALHDASTRNAKTLCTY